MFDLYGATLGNQKAKKKQKNKKKTHTNQKTKKQAKPWRNRGKTCGRHRWDFTWHISVCILVFCFFVFFRKIVYCMPMKNKAEKHTCTHTHTHTHTKNKKKIQKHKNTKNINFPFCIQLHTMD